MRIKDFVTRFAFFISILFYRQQRRYCCCRMNFFKLLFIFILLFLATFAQRFYRHSNNGTPDELINGIDSDNLASDGTNVEQENDNVKLIGYGEEIKLELKSDILKFKFCSEHVYQRCMDNDVEVCYDCVNPYSNAKGNCGPNQCEFKAGVFKEDAKKFIWFSKLFVAKQLKYDDDACATAVMQSPTTDMKISIDPTFMTSFASCNPLLIDGNVVKLFVKKASKDCFLTVMNAKIWTPTTPSPTTSGAPNSEKEGSSNATTIWIIVGFGLSILVIILVGLGIWYYCTRMQKKNGVGKKNIIPTSQKTNVEAAIKEKAEDKKEAVKPKEKNEDTKEKKETLEEAKPAKPKKKEVKEKKATVEHKPSKEITQNEKVETVNPKKKASVEPTLDDPTTDASIVQPNHFPTVQVPKTQILPAPKSCNSKGDSHSSKKGSLSGRHEVGMQIMVESPPDSVQRHCFGLIDDATKVKLDKFYPTGKSTRVFEKREILLFCCSRVSIMFKGIEILIDMAIEALAERDVKFDDKDNIVEMSPEAEKYLRQKSTPEITRSFAFGSIFRDLIDSRADIYETYSIPLLFCIVLQRRYTVLNRRKAFIWIRRQLPIIYAEFTLKERKKLAYPLNAIEEMHKLDPEGFKDVAGFHTESGMEEDETQASKTGASEKNRKKESGGKKKKSKKRR